MRSLEDALAIAHNSEIRGAHPLLNRTLSDDDEPEFENESLVSPVQEEVSESQQVSIAKALGSFHLEGAREGFGGPSTSAEVTLPVYCPQVEMLTWRHTEHS